LPASSDAGIVLAIGKQTLASEEASYKGRCCAGTAAHFGYVWQNPETG
jgi:hypothetical protein